MSASQDQEWIITLVHGTWARGFFPSEQRVKTVNDLRWFEYGSKFRRHLDRSLEGHSVSALKIVAFKWSGANSFFERDRAGMELAKELDAQKIEHPDARQLVIAHSYGANVAIRALAHLETPRRLFIATLASPFIEVFAPHRHNTPADRNLFFASGLSAAFFAYLYMAFNYDWPMSLKWFLIVIAVTGVALYQTINHLDRKRRAEMSSYIDRIAEASSHAPLQKGMTDLLTVRGVNDEAALAIAAGAVSNRLGVTIVYRLVDLLYVSFGLLLLGMVGMIVTAFAFRYLPPPLMSSIDKILMEKLLPFSLIGAGAAMTGIFISIFLGGTFLSVHGRELLYSLFDAEINFSSAPDTRGHITIHTLTRGSNVNRHRPLRHAIYDDYECASQIVAWVKARCLDALDLSESDRRRPQRLDGAASSNGAE